METPLKSLCYKERKTWENCVKELQDISVVDNCPRTIAPYEILVFLLLALCMYLFSGLDDEYNTS